MSSRDKIERRGYLQVHISFQSSSAQRESLREEKEKERERFEKEKEKEKEKDRMKDKERHWWRKRVDTFGSLDSYHRLHGKRTRVHAYKASHPGWT